jgi:pimeloyl-ACP methyl ester carboxylesterase
MPSPKTEPAAGAAMTSTSTKVTLTQPVVVAPRIPRPLMVETPGLAGRFWPPSARVEQAAWRALHDPVSALQFAVSKLTLATDPVQRLEAFAQADLLVTGRKARAKWDKAKLDRKSLGALRGGIKKGQTGDVDGAWKRIWDRLDAVTAHLDLSGPRPLFSPREDPHWIATCAEVDLPRGPVNVPRSGHPEKTITLTVEAIGDRPFDVRYVAIGDLAKAKRVVLYLHGLGSRAEEAVATGQALVRLDPTAAVISPDLPWNGYTTAPALHDDALFLDYGRDVATRFPALEALAAFVRAFVEATKIGPRLSCVAGGSLGGTLTMRMTLPESALRPPRAAFWSPAGLWEAQNTEFIKFEVACQQLFGGATRDEDGPQGRAARDDYFRFNFTDETPGIRKPNTSSWWSPRFLATKDGLAHLDGAIDDRIELYREPLRRMQYRLAYEQFCFSLRTPKIVGFKDRFPDVGAATKAKAGVPARPAIPLLLMCGTADNQTFVNIFDRMKDLAATKTALGQPGRAVWFEGAGHSIHDECPDQVAAALAAHLA